MRLLPLADFPLDVSHTELVDQLKGDQSLQDILTGVVSLAEIASRACSYVVQNQLLFRKWTSLSDEGVEGVVFQLVVPERFRPLVWKNSS